ncbi:hypothetical protein [Sorangium sp. So ce1000]|uniref:hypothetical protein n=1 Tax=Sorangium sp. So ce1000 TaxID=3133325 RepID=UPI003F60C59B
MRTTAFLMLALAGCGGDDEISASDVLSLSVHGDNPAVEAPPADGRSVVAVEVCTPLVENRRADLKASVSISAGRWEGISDGALTLTVPLGRDTCAVRRFTAGNVAGPVRVTATLEGFTPPAEQIELAPAAIERVELWATPLVLTAGKASQVQVQTAVRAPNLGKPSAGTTVDFAIEAVTPEGATAVVGPSRVEVKEDGSAATTLMASPEVTSVVVRATATPPAGTSTTPEPVTAQVELTSVSP